MTGPRTVGNVRRMLVDTLAQEVKATREEIADYRAKVLAAELHLAALIQHAAIEGVDVSVSTLETLTPAQQS